MNADEWLRDHGAMSESPWERLFVVAVFRQVSGLDFSTLASQWTFRDLDGKTRRADFVVREGDDIRLAIEVDSYAHHGTTREQFLSDHRKEQSLRMDGWAVLRFPNSQFGKPGAPDPSERGKGAASVRVSFNLN